MLPVFSMEPMEPVFIPPPCRLRALSRRRRLLLSRCSFCLFCTSIRAVMNVFFTSFSNSSSSRRANWPISSSEYSRMAASTRCSSSTSAELGIRLRPAEQMRVESGTDEFHFVDFSTLLLVTSNKKAVQSQMFNLNNFRGMER